jgi:hypothetical protein
MTLIQKIELLLHLFDYLIVRITFCLNVLGMNRNEPHSRIITYHPVSSTGQAYRPGVRAGTEMVPTWFCCLVFPVDRSQRPIP